MRTVEPLIGTWTITGDAEGESTFAWMDGGFFVLQRGHLTKGRTHTFLEVVGFEHGFETTEPPADITSRVYTTPATRSTTPTKPTPTPSRIWGGAKGSPAAYRGRWNGDRTALTGAWKWPGGGYATVMTRASEPAAGP